MVKASSQELDSQNSLHSICGVKQYAKSLSAFKTVVQLNVEDPVVKLIKA